MTVYTGLVVQEYATILYLVFSSTHKERRFRNNNLLDGSQRHKPIKLFDNKMWIDPIGKHPKNSTSDNNHNIFNNMDFFDLCWVFEVANEAVLFFHGFVREFSDDGFEAVVEEYHDCLVDAISAYLEVCVADHLVGVWVCGVF